MIQSTPQTGFALLMTIIVVGVVVAIGLSVLDLSIKQVRLTSTSQDSEIAFHAANAGLECARFTRLANASEMELGNPVSPACFNATGVTAPAVTVTTPNPIDLTTGTTPIASGDGDAFRYQWEITWGNDSARRCSRMSILVASTTPLGTGITTTNMDTLFPGYDGDEHTCEASARCTVISVQGFNKPCTSVGQPGTVQREVLLQF